MAEKAPAFQFYAQDFLSDERVALMSMREVGAYILLLSHAWIEGSVPDSVVAAAKIWRVSPAEARKVWPSVRACFQELGDGRLINPRQEEERAKLSAWREKSREGGRRSAITRWGNGDKQNVTVVTECLQPNRNSSSSSSTSSRAAAVLKTTSIQEQSERQTAAAAAFEPPLHTPDPYPQTTAAVRSYFPVDGEFLTRLVEQALGAKPGATDEQIAEAVYATHRNGKQQSPGLWLRTVPEFLVHGPPKTAVQRQMERI